MKNNNILPRAKKRFGQNFLVDENVLQEIIAAAEIKPTDTVLEIGAGTGILTAELAQRAARVITVEIDRDLAANLPKFKNVELVEGDFLKETENIFAKVSGKIKVIANIPYYITTPILEKLLECRAHIETVTLMVQKEVADRICAEPCGKEYGSLSIFLKYYADVYFVCLVPPQAFRPRPQVDSAVVRLDMRAELKYRPLSEKRFFNIVRGAFWGRRKTLRNTLKQSPYTHYTNAVLEKMAQETGLDLNRRGETLGIEEFVTLSNVEIKNQSNF